MKYEQEGGGFLLFFINLVIKIIQLALPTFSIEK